MKTYLFFLKAKYTGELIYLKCHLKSPKINYWAQAKQLSIHLDPFLELCVENGYIWVKGLNGMNKPVN